MLVRSFLGLLVDLFGSRGRLGGRGVGGKFFTITLWEYLFVDFA